MLIVVVLQLVQFLVSNRLSVHGYTTKVCYLACYCGCLILSLSMLLNKHNRNATAIKIPRLCRRLFSLHRNKTSQVELVVT